MNLRLLFTTGLRIAVGWHFLYQGMTKLLSDHWSAHDFLANSTGFMAAFYHRLAASPELIKVVDLLNMWGLLAIGLGLCLGVLVRWAAGAGVVLLMLYYFAYPPFGPSLLTQPEGGIYVVNRQLIEAAVLAVFAFSREGGYGIGRLVGLLRDRGATGDAAGSVTAVRSRREVLWNLSTIPALGLLGWGASTSRYRARADVMSGATIKVRQSSIDDLKGELPTGRIGGHEISRLVAGGNLIGGWAHSRDLIYVPSLLRAYNTEQKIYDTLMLAEQAGINTINIGFASNPVLEKYKAITGSRIKVISQVAPDMDGGDYFAQINRAIDHGVDILQVQGNWCDWLVRDGRIEVIAAMMERIRGQGYTAGLASHTVDSLIACEEQGIIPDYYMKTMHHDRYWSAHPVERRVPFEVDGQRSDDHNRFHDNIFCLFPDKTVDFVSRAKVPVMGFKVLAAGAIQPADGFRWAFENGADFICVGMLDFQIVEDVNIAIDTIAGLSNRKREWLG